MVLQRFIEKDGNSNFDVIIIGGGISGAAMAYEAAGRGLSVALFEKSDYGGATSSATSKLIHGGLRYLKNMELGLVRESLKERKIMSDIAPNFVYPLPFMIPVYGPGKKEKWMLEAGMVLYDGLSYDKGFTRDPTKKLGRFKKYNSEETLQLECCVKPENLEGSMVYYDTQNIFPERLTLAFLKSAARLGAQLSNYSRVKRLLRNNGVVTGVEVVDEKNNREKTFTSPVTINCTGPWADILLENSGTSSSRHHVRRSEGIHIITKKLCNEHAVSVMTDSGRHMMVMPWRNLSLIGTTDNDFNGDPDNYKVSRERIEGLLNEVNTYYNTKEKLQYEDVMFYYGGLRPLADADTENTYDSSRKYEIYDNAEDGFDGLFTVEGGKYTTSRQLAVDVMKQIEKKLPVNSAPSNSNKVFLYGSEIQNMDLFMESLHRSYPDFQEATIDFLGKNYGTVSHEIFMLAREDKSLAEVVNTDGEILAEVAYALRYESVLHLTDILFRRTGIGGTGHPGNDILEKVGKLAAHHLKWSKKELRKEMEEVQRRFRLPE